MRNHETPVAQANVGRSSNIPEGRGRALPRIVSNVRLVPPRGMALDEGNPAPEVGSPAHHTPVSSNDRNGPKEWKVVGDRRGRSGPCARSVATPRGATSEGNSSGLLNYPGRVVA